MSQTSRKGAIAEAAITLAATEMGIVVFRPVIEGRRYDLVFDAGKRPQMGAIAAQHADRVTQGDPVQRAQVRIQNKNCLHRGHPQRIVVVDLERTTGLEPAAFTMAR